MTCFLEKVFVTAILLLLKLQIHTRYIATSN